MLDGKSAPVDVDSGVIEVGPLGDLNGDGLVGVTDLIQLLTSWGRCEPPCPPLCPADLDGDCGVRITDLLILLSNWS